MICISESFLQLIGMTSSEIRTLSSGSGLFVSSLYSFGGKGNGGLDIKAMMAEPEARQLNLIGMADRYGAARDNDPQITVCEMCSIDGEITKPQPAERAWILSVLDGLRDGSPSAGRIADHMRGVREMAADDAPPHPFTGQRVKGWYWREADGSWSAEPAPSGRPEAEHNAARAASSAAR